ncbi:MAG: hypothetical protein WAL25_14040 [Acidimicrobiia bacterium]
MIKRIGVLTVFAMIVVSCGGDGGGAIDVSLFEWEVDAPSSASAGEVTFNATNDGGEAHELVIVKGVAPEDLPVDEDGRVIEDDLPDGSFVGEIEEFDAGLTESASFDLEEGTYTLFCNIIEEDDGEVESHFQNGMVTTLEVTS